MAEQKNEVVKSFGEQLGDKLTVAQAALPKDFNRERFINNAIAVVNANPGLRNNPRQLFEGLMKAALLGLDFVNKECYLIQYGNDINFQTDYKGEVKFTKKYSVQPIKDIYAKVVRQGDVFTERIVGGMATIDFEPKPFNDADIIGAFAVCVFKDGSMIYETMSTKDIQSVRNNYSKASQSKAWKNSFDEMAKKTVLRRLCKHIDTDFESIEARNAWEESSGMEFASSYSDIDHTQIVNAFEKKEEKPADIPIESEDVTPENIEIPDIFK
jgi:recombination protein RecT